MISNSQRDNVDASEWWRWFARRSVLLPAAGLLVLVIGVWVLYDVTRQKVTRETSLDSAIKAADSAFHAGNYGESLQELKEVGEDQLSADEKIALYTNMAASAASAGNVPEAISYMERKHAIDPASAKVDAYIVGTYYERIGDTDSAIKQYKIALAYQKSLPESTNTAAKIESLEARINSLGG